MFTRSRVSRSSCRAKSGKIKTTYRRLRRPNSLALAFLFVVWQACSKPKVLVDIGGTEFDCFCDCPGTTNCPGAVTHPGPGGSQVTDQCPNQVFPRVCAETNTAEQACTTACQEVTIVGGSCTSICVFGCPIPGPSRSCSPAVGSCSIANENNGQGWEVATQNLTHSCKHPDPAPSRDVQTDYPGYSILIEPSLDAVTATVDPNSSEVSVSVSGASGTFHPTGQLIFSGGFCATPVCSISMEGVFMQSVDPFTISGSTATNLRAINHGGFTGQVLPGGLIVFDSLPPFDVSANIDGQFGSIEGQATFLLGQLSTTPPSLSLLGQIVTDDGSADFSINAPVANVPPIPVIDGSDLGECSIPVTLSAARSSDIGDTVVDYSWFLASGPSRTFLSFGDTLTEVFAPGQQFVEVQVFNSHMQYSVGLAGITINNTPPTANAGASQVVACLSPTTTPVQLDGSGSSDPFGRPIGFYWSIDGGAVSAQGVQPVVSLPVGSHNVVLTASNPCDATTSATTTVSIVEQDPVANAGPGQVVECASHQGTLVQLDGSGSTDPFGRTLTYGWSVDGVATALAGARPTILLPLGTHTISLTVTDPCNGTSTATESVTIQDTTPPTVSNLANNGPACLWPPNGKWVDLSLGGEITAVVSDVCDPNPIFLIGSVTNSEPDSPSTSDGDGDQTGDSDVAEFTDHVCLRSERDGNDPAGRTYTISVLAEDHSGNRSASQSENVTVPHDQGGGHCAKVPESAFVPDGDPRCTVTPSAAASPASGSSATTPPSGPPGAAPTLTLHGCAATHDNGADISLLALIWGLLALGRRRSRLLWNNCRAAALITVLVFATGFSACNQAGHTVSSDSGVITATQALTNCLSGVWNTSPAPCGISKACTSSPQGELKRACEAQDCMSAAFFYYGDDAYVQGTVIGSPSQSLFCASKIASGSWGASSASQISRSFGGPPQVVNAQCDAVSATVANVSQLRSSAVPSDVLIKRAASNDWVSCSY